MIRARAGRANVAPVASTSREPDDEQRIRELQRARREHGSLFPWEREELRSLTAQRGSADGGQGGDRALGDAMENDINAHIRRASGRGWA